MNLAKLIFGPLELNNSIKNSLTNFWTTAAYDRYAPPPPSTYDRYAPREYERYAPPMRDAHPSEYGNLNLNWHQILIYEWFIDPIYYLMIVFLIKLNIFTERYRDYRDYSRGKLY